MLPDIRTRTQMTDILGFGYRHPTPGGKLHLVPEEADVTPAPPPPRATRDNEPEVTSRAVSRSDHESAMGPPPWHRWPRDDSRTAAKVSVEGQVNALERMTRLAHDRLAMLESRIETLGGRFEDRGSSDAETHRRLQIAHRELDDQYQNSVRDAQQKAASLTDFKVRAERELHVQREHIRSLQNEFQEFAISAVAKTRQDMEQAIKTQLARNALHEDEWRQEIKKHQTLMKDEMHRQRHLLEDLEQKASDLRGDMRSRVLVLENAMLRPHEVAQDTGLRAHIDELRSQVTKMGVQIVETQQTLEEETTQRTDNVNGFRTTCQDLEHLIAQLRKDVMEKTTQNRDLLEGKMSVDRQDLLARLAEKCEELDVKNQTLTVAIADLEAKMLGKADNFTKCEAAEREALKDILDTKMQQFLQSSYQNEEARAASLASLYQNVETFQQKQLETVQAIRQEVQDSLQDTQVLMRNEMGQRLDGERKIGTSMRDVTRHLQNLIITQAESLQKQHDGVSKQVDEMQKDSSHRAERLSRYIDDVSSKIYHDVTKQREAIDDQLNCIRDRLGDVHVSVSRHIKHNEQEFERLNEDHTLKLRKVNREMSEALQHDKRRCEQQKQFFDRRLQATENDLTQRLTDYIEDFDKNVKSIQHAILGLGRDKTNISVPMVAPLPTWEKPEMRGDTLDASFQESLFDSPNAAFDSPSPENAEDASFGHFARSVQSPLPVPGSPDTLPLRDDMRAVDSPYMWKEEDSLSSNRDKAIMGVLPFSPTGVVRSRTMTPDLPKPPFSPTGVVRSRTETPDLPKPPSDGSSVRVHDSSSVAGAAAIPGGGEEDQLDEEKKNAAEEENEETGGHENVEATGDAEGEHIKDENAEKPIERPPMVIPNLSMRKEGDVDNTLGSVDETCRSDGMAADATFGRSDVAGEDTRALAAHDSSADQGKKCATPEGGVHEDNAFRSQAPLVLDGADDTDEPLEQGDEAMDISAALSSETGEAVGTQDEAVLLADDALATATESAPHEAEGPVAVESISREAERAVKVGSVQQEAEGPVTPDSALQGAEETPVVESVLQDAKLAPAAKSVLPNAKVAPAAESVLQNAEEAPAAESVQQNAERAPVVKSAPQDAEGASADQIVPLNEEGVPVVESVPQDAEVTAAAASMPLDAEGAPAAESVSQDAQGDATLESVL